MKFARRRLQWLLGGSLVGLVAGVLAQTPVADLITLLRTATRDAQRWDAALALGAATFTSPAERDVARLALEEALASRDAGLRVNAATALGRLGDSRSVAALERALSDGHPLVRQAAARALGRVGDEAAARVLLKGFRDPHLAVRAQVIHALGETKQPLAIPALEKILLAKSGEPNAPLRAEAARSLEAMGSLSVPTLLKGIRSGDASVRLYAARSLGNVGNPDAIGALVSLFSDADSSVVAEAVSALGRLGEPALPKLLEQLESERVEVRLNAARALGIVGAPAVGPVRNLYNTATARIAELRDERAVAIALAEAQRQRVVLPPTVPPEQTVSSAPDTGGEAFGMPPLTDAEIRREVARLKARMKSIKRRTQRAEELVRLRQREENYNQRYDAAQAYLVGEAPSKPVPGSGVSGLQPFLVTVPEQEPNVALPPPGTNETLPTARPLPLIDREIEGWTRRARAAILALGSIGNDEAVAALAEIVRRGELDEATLAAEALGQTRHPNALPVLVGALGDTTFPVSVRANAATALGRFSAAAARDALTQAAAEDLSPTVRQAARSALANLRALTTP